MLHARSGWPNNCVTSSVPASAGLQGLGESAMSYGGLPPPEVAQTSSAMYSNTSTFSWAHTVPNLMPWVTQSSDSRVPDPIVHFTAPPDPCTSQTALNWDPFGTSCPTVAHPHLKRKCELDALETIPPKICITEERMAERFKEMHISNQYAVPSGGSSAFPLSTPVEEESITNIHQLDSIFKDSGLDLHSPSKSLVLAPELKKLVEPEKIFAQTFFTKVERPSMALVVWQPQPNPLLRTQEDEALKEHENNNCLPQRLIGPCNQATLSSQTPVTDTSFDVDMDS